MSTEPAPRYDFTDDPDGFTKDDFRRSDPVLDIFLSVTVEDDKVDATIPLTVTTKGTVVSGLAVSFSRWSRDLTSQLKDFGGEPGEFLAGVIKQITDAIVGERAKVVAKREAEDRPTPDTQYLNLKEAVLHADGRKISLGLWRVDKRSIDGWTIGSF